MDDSTRKQILDIIDEHRIMTIATVRPDGYPQATTVTYVHDGLALYFACGRSSQKVSNIRQNPRVSLTIDHDEEDVNRIRGISLGGRAEVLAPDGPEYRRALELMATRFPELKTVPESEMQEIAVVKVVPEVISLLDYTKGFGHTELVRV